MISEQSLEGWDNNPVEFSNVKYPQTKDDNAPKNFFLAIFCGSRGSGKTYFLNDRIQFVNSLGNISSSSVYVVSAAYGTTSFALYGLTPDTSGTVTHRRYRYTSDIYNTGWATTTQPNVGNIEKFNLNTIGYYNPTDKSNND